MSKYDEIINMWRSWGVFSDKAAYYAALEANDRTEEITPMYDFLRLETERTWGKSLERGKL